MILELARKIRSKVSGNGTLANSVRGIYLVKAPEGQAYPYITYFPVTEMPIHLHANSRVEDTIWQFTIFHTSMIGLGTIYGNLTTALDGSSLGLGTLAQVGLGRGLTSALEVESIENSPPIFRQSVEYRVHVK